MLFALLGAGGIGLLVIVLGVILIASLQRDTPEIPTLPAIAVTLPSAQPARATLAPPLPATTTAALPQADTPTLPPLPISATPSAFFTPVTPSATPSHSPTPEAANGSPRGMIVFTCQVTRSEEANQICVMNVDGSGYRQLTFEGNNIYASFAPDNQSAVYISDLYGNEDIFEVDMSGNINRITQGDGPWTAPHISPDGSSDPGRAAGQPALGAVDDEPQRQQPALHLHLPYRTRRLGPGLVTGWQENLVLIGHGWSGAALHDQRRRLRADTGDRHRWFARAHDWSPDNIYIATYAGGSWEREIYLMQPDGSNLRAITFGGNNLAPSFSPDGQWIVFTSYRDNYGVDDGCEIYIMMVMRPIAGLSSRAWWRNDPSRTFSTTATP